ncbi:hypothetical protein HBA55_24455 [Pseudomaricurvus alkylphenolicus]|jgi:5'-nucleotidase|uniref:5'/3'-nucleotidase SurE n=1 Tax=Pseudomaricurvus alkylphenolicus TaxID=1306991 RepID=UPI001423DF14|nr:5'/3'-nucleotidase SurE [Pseudomaricurvus alkylphenolicus]NIB42782.1 hypothetical protein [Pseudomaricurvus alkylphenolicus]
MTIKASTRKTLSKGLLGSILGSALICSSFSASALNIALTNDDGWTSVGIHALKSALEADGHQVTLVASSTQQSGSSAGLNVGPVAVTKQAAGVFSVARADGSDGAEPATCALIAIDVAGDPDLLISGINDGANIGSFTQISGTVGASVAALSSTLNGSVPAIAVSTDEMDCDETEDPETCQQQHFNRVARFTADLVAHLERKPGFLRKEEKLLPPGVGLNVNYPPVELPLGIKLSRQGQTASLPGLPFAAQLKLGCNDCATLQVGETTSAGLDFGATVPDSNKEARDSDTKNYNAGYITIVPTQPDYTYPLYRRFSGALHLLSADL